MIDTLINTLHFHAGKWQLRMKGPYSALLSCAQFPTEIIFLEKKVNQWPQALVKVRVQDMRGKSLTIVNYGHSLNAVDLLHFSQGFDPETNLYFSFISIVSLHSFDCSLFLQSVLFKMDYSQHSDNF